MGKRGTLMPADWGAIMPAHSPLAHRPPYYYRDTEMVMVQFATDEAAALALMPAELELMEPATAFMVMEQNHWTTIGGYGEVYLGIMCLWDGEPHAYVPGVYVTGENSQILGREIWGFGKKRCRRFEIRKHDNGEVEAVMDIRPDDRALRAVVQTQANAGGEILAPIPLICLKVIPDVAGGVAPALAQLTSVTFKAEPYVGTDGKAEVFTGPATIAMAVPSDVNIPVLEIHAGVHARFTADLPYGKVLKTYSASDFG
jgi:acetoacetate decarboxylase